MADIFKPTRAWDKEDAFYAILIAAAWSDQHLAAEEDRELAALTARTPTLSALSDGRKAEMFKQIKRNLDVGFESTVETACASLPAEMRVSAFSHAVDIIYADRVILPLEARFLNKLVELLQIPEDKARAVQQAMAEKNAF